MNWEKITYTGGMCIVVVIIILIGFGIKRQGSINSNLYKNCEPTDFFVIGNRGVVTRVYDCTGIELENERE